MSTNVISNEVRNLVKRKRIKFVDINKLKRHEEINQNHLEDIIQRIKQDGFIKNPVVVDRKNHIILDGHHRVAALRQLGANKVPAFLVNYQSNNIRVTLRRKEFLFKDIKKAVINYCLKGKIFPSKTTRHLIKNRPKNINIKISNLFNKH